jgi:DNA-binding beta-propeller fold protein YncE
VNVSRFVMLLLCALSLASCTEPPVPDPPVPVIKDEPFSGVAYPSRHKPLDVPAAGLGIVTDSRSDTLTVLDLGTGQRIAQLLVGRDPVTIDGPGQILIDEQAGAVYVALTYPPLYGLPPHEGDDEFPPPRRFGYVQRLDLRDLSITGEVRLDPGIGDIALSADRKQLIATSYDWDPEGIHLSPKEWNKPLDVIDLEAFAPIGTSEPRRISLCISPNGMVLSGASGSRVFAACKGDDTLSIADLNDPTASVKQIPVSDQPGEPYLPKYAPFAVALAPDGKTIAVTTTITNTIRFFDVASETFQPAKTISPEGYVSYLTYSADGARLFIPIVSPDALHVIDPGNGNAEVARRDFTPQECHFPFRVALNGPNLLLVCRGNRKTPGRVLSLDGMTLATLWSAEVGLYPDAIAVRKKSSP